MQDPKLTIMVNHLLIVNRNIFIEVRLHEFWVQRMKRLRLYFDFVTLALAKIIAHCICYEFVGVNGFGFCQLRDLVHQVWFEYDCLHARSPL